MATNPIISGKEGYFISIEGCPVIFGSMGTKNLIPNYTGSISQNTITLTDGSETVSGLLFPGGLDASKLSSWSESINPIDCELSVDGMSFYINDSSFPFTTNTTEIAALYRTIYSTPSTNIGTDLFTRNQIPEIFITNVSTSMNMSGSQVLNYSGDLSIYIAEGTNKVWIGNHVYVVESSNVLTKTITVNKNVSLLDSNNTVYYLPEFFGTLIPEDDYIDSIISPNSNFQIPAYNKFPGLLDRRIILWRYENSISSSYPIWRGRCNAAPRVNSESAQIEIQAESFATKLKQDTYDIEPIKTKLKGFDSRRVTLVQDNTVIGRLANQSRIDEYLSLDTITEETDIVFDNINQCLTAPVLDNNSSTEDFYGYGVGQHPINEGTETEWFIIRPRDPHKQKGKSILFQLNYKGNDEYVGKKAQTLSYVSESVNPRNPREITGRFPINLLPSFGDDETLQVVKNYGDNQQLFIEGISQPINIPEETGDWEINCLISHLFKGELNSIDRDKSLPGDKLYHERNLYFYNGSYNFARQNPIDGSAPKEILYLESGSIIIRDKDLTKTTESNRAFHPILNACELENFIGLKSYHLINTLRYGIAQYHYNDRDFYFPDTEYSRLTYLIPQITAELFVSPEDKFGDLFSTIGKFFGVSLRTAANGRYKLTKINKPRENSKSVLTITSKDLLETPTWEYVADNIITDIEITGQSLSGGKLTLINQTARALTNTKRKVEFNLEDLGIEASLNIAFETDKISFLTDLLTKYYFNMFTYAYNKCVITIPINNLNRVFPGDFISLSDWFLPNGSGTRALSNQKMLVLEKEVDLQDGKIKLTCIYFSGLNGYGYSPCARISGINIGTKTLTLATNFISTSETNNVKDYAGSNLVSYGGTSNDGGIGWFGVGDKIELILRDTETLTTESLTITSVGSNTITVAETITSSPVNWAFQATLGNVDIRYNSYNTSGFLSSQKKFGYFNINDKTRFT